MPRRRPYSAAAEQALATAIQRDRERQTGNNGEAPDDFFAHGFQVYLGVAQAPIPTGGSGSVNIWSGKKGSESDSKITINDVFNRFAPLIQGQQCLFAGFDQGFEVVDLNQSGSGSSYQPCNCKVCTTGSPQLWSFVTGTDLRSYLLTGGVGGPWTSPPFSWGGAGTNLTWTLTPPGTYATLTLNGFSGYSLQYRCPADLWAPNCTNTMTLFNPYNSPPTSNVPCTVCIVPTDQTVGGNCPACPTAASFTFSATQQQQLYQAVQAVIDSNLFTGTFEVPLTSVVEAVAGGADQVGCNGTLQIGTSNVAHGSSPVTLTVTRGALGGNPPTGCVITVQCNLWGDPNGLWSLNDSSATCSGPVTLNGTGGFGVGNGTLIVTFTP